MKLITIILGLVLLFAAPAKAEQIDSTKVELSKEQIYSDVKSALKQLGEALEVGAEHVYTVLVKQQIVRAVTDIVIFVVLLVAAIILIKSAMKAYAHAKEKGLAYAEEENRMGFCVFLSIVAGIVSVISIVDIILAADAIVTGFVNPEYGAIRDIMGFFKRGC